MKIIALSSGMKLNAVKYRYIILPLQPPGYYPADMVRIFTDHSPR